LFTCSNVRFVCAAIWRFSSSVGYGCCNMRCHWCIRRLLVHYDSTQFKLHCNLNQHFGHHYPARHLVQDW
jgi:hypothetical protein